MKRSLFSTVVLPAGAPSTSSMPPGPQPGPQRPFTRSIAPMMGTTRAVSTASSPFVAPMYWACAGLLGIIAELGVARSALPSAMELRHSIEQQLALMMQHASQAGIPPEDIIDAQYAIVALIDEQLARAQGWQGQLEWRSKPLQLLRFNENTAGENFFRRLQVLEGQPHRVHVLQVYVMCLAAGFQGRYAVSGGEGMAAIYERLAMIVAHATGADAISPHGEPRGERNFLQREAPIVRIALGLLGTGLLVFVLMKVVLLFEIRSTTRTMHDYATSTSATAPGKR